MPDMQRILTNETSQDDNFWLALIGVIIGLVAWIVLLYLWWLIKGKLNQRRQIHQPLLTLNDSNKIDLPIINVTPESFQEVKNSMQEENEKMKIELRAEIDQLRTELFQQNRQNTTANKQMSQSFNEKMEGVKDYIDNAVTQQLNVKILKIKESLEENIKQLEENNENKHSQIRQDFQQELAKRTYIFNLYLSEVLEKKKQEEHSLINKNIESLQLTLQLTNKELKQSQENIVQYKNELEQRFNFEILKSSLNQFGNQITQQIDSVIKELQQKVNEQETRLIPQDPDRKELAYQTIQKLYEQSINKRHVEIAYKRFVRDIQSEQELFKNYSIRSSEMKEKLRGFCTKFRQVRGDGNCFYTAFGYQFLLILLNKYNDQPFGEFIKRMKDLNLPMKINLQDIKIDDQNIEQKLLYEFLFRLENLRMIPDLKDREEAFTIEYGSYEKEGEIDGIFYGLSTIFFRNLANLAVESSESLAALYDRQNLLIWETECNSNEVVVQALAQYLKIHITLIFFDNGGFKENFFGKELNDRIILLIKPGHYNVGIKQSENVEMPKDQQKLEVQKQVDTSTLDIYMIQTIQGLSKKFQPICQGFIYQISNGQQNQY